MKFLKKVETGSKLGRRTWRLEIDDRPAVVRSFAGGDAHQQTTTGLPDPFQVSLCRVDGVAYWRDFYALSDDDRRRLELGREYQFLAIRPYIEGDLLQGSKEKAARMWAPWARQIAFSLRALHAQKWLHGDLHPGNIVIDDDGRPRLVGLALMSEEFAEEPARQAAPLRAPELWEGKEPTPESDVYSLAILICWMAAGGDYPIRAEGPDDWARAHRDETPVIPATIPAEVATLLKRCLVSRPQLRPQLQALIDKLAPADDRIPFAALPPSLYRRLEKKVLEQLDRDSPMVILKGEAGTGKTFALERIFARLRLAGSQAVLCTSDAVWGPAPGEIRKIRGGTAPWDGIRQLINALSKEDDEAPLPAATGDFRNVVETWTRRLKEALPHGETVVLWDDLDRSGPDIQAFWMHALPQLSGSSDETQKTLRIVATAGADGEWEGPASVVPIVGPDEGAWNGWRVRTRLAEVRDIDADHWQELVQRHGKRPVDLFAAIHDELGIDDLPDFARIRSSRSSARDVSVIFAGDWRRHLEGLITGGAYLQAIDTCRRLYEVLARSGRSERMGVLRVWADALARTGYRPVEVIALERALSETGEPNGPGAEAIFLQAELYHELGWTDQALEVLDELEALDEPHQLEKLRWKAQALLSSGRLDEAKTIAEEALTDLAPSAKNTSSAAPHLRIVHQGAQAMSGNRAAIEELRQFAPTLEHRDIPPQRRAQCHIYRAIGLARHGEFEESTEAYLRALEEVESAGFLSSLPPYLLDVGLAYRRQGHLGLAREHFARGQRYAHEGTRHSTRALLIVHEAQIDIILGRLDAAQSLSDEALRFADAHGLGSIAAMCGVLAGDIQSARNNPTKAIQIYRKAIERGEASSESRAKLLLRTAEASMDAGQHLSVDELIGDARRIIEEENIAELTHYMAMTRARRDLLAGEEFDAMTAIQQFRRHLLAAEEKGQHDLVLQQSHHLWHRAEDDGHRELLREVARAFHAAKLAVSIGLPREIREAFSAKVPAIPHPDQLEHTADPHRIESLSQANRELRQQLKSRDDKISQLEQHCAELEDRLRLAQSSSPDNEEPSRRGRKPKATRQQVVEALERADRDYERAADHLGVSKRTVYRYVKKFGLDR